MIFDGDGRIQISLQSGAHRKYWCWKNLSCSTVYTGQWHRQTEEVGGAEVRGSGGQSPGAEPRWRSGIPQKPTLIHKFIVAKSRCFHYNLRNPTSRGLEVFRVFDEWFTEAD